MFREHPAEIGVQPFEGSVGIEGREVDGEQAGAVDALLPLVANSFQNAEALLGRGTFPGVRINPVQELGDFLLGEVLVRVPFVDGGRNFARRARSVTEAQHFPVEFPHTAESVGLRNLDDVADLAGEDLLADFQVGAKLGLAPALGQNAAQPQAGGTKPHEMLPREAGA